MTSAQPHQAILALLDTYFEGLHRADSALLATVFHPDARYVSAVAEDYRVLSFPEYRTLLDQRTAPASNGERRIERVISIETAEPSLAFARVEMTMMGRDYTDFLTLIYTQDRWVIMAKVFLYETADQGH